MERPVTDTITWGFTHLVASRDGDLTTTKCGGAATAPGWLDQGTKCPDCYGIPETPSTGTTGPISYGRTR